MSSLCKQCAEKTWGKDCPGDFKGITTQNNWDNGFAMIVLCEGCGICQVDPEERCTGNCLCPEHNKEE